MADNDYTPRNEAGDDDDLTRQDGLNKGLKIVGWLCVAVAAVAIVWGCIYAVKDFCAMDAVDDAASPAVEQVN